MKQDQKVPFLHRLELFGYVFIEKLVCSIPDGSLASVARFFAFLAYQVFRIRRQVTFSNLQIAFPHRDERWRRKVAYFSYLHFALMILEFMKMQKWDVKQIEQKVERQEIDEILRAAQKGKGGIVVSGHFGNWEIAMGYLHSKRVRSVVIQQRQNNRLIDERMRKLRQKWGMGIIYPRGAVEASEQALAEGKIVGLLGDQDAGERGVFVPFLGQPASTHIGAAVLKLRSKAPLFVGFCRRVKCSNFEFYCQSVHIPDSLVVNDENVRMVTAEIQKNLEHAIRRYPEQYFWMHRRWKTTPR